MSRIICPYADDDCLVMTCILEAKGETNIDCDKCTFGKAKRNISVVCRDCGKVFTESKCLGRVSAGTKLLKHKPFCKGSSNTGKVKA